MDKKYDIAVIGGGPGGYTAAIRGAQLGLSVCLIEKDKVGGTCLNNGCIPTKSLTATSEFIENVSKSIDYGVIIDSAKVDFKRVMDRKDQIVDRLRGGVEFLLKKNKVDVIFGHGRLMNKNQIEVMSGISSSIIETDKIIIAAGSKPASLPGMECDGSIVLNSAQMLQNRRFPRSLIIVGGGVIGCEFAFIFSSMGSKVTVIEAMPRLLPTLDEELGRSLSRKYKKDEIDVLCNTKITGVDKFAGGLKVKAGEKSIEAQMMLVSIGRVSNADDLCVENAGVLLNEIKEICIDSRMETNIKGIYAVGDATTARNKLAHTASYQAVIAVDNIAGNYKEADYSCVPGCVFTRPEIASVGLTEQEAIEREVEFVKGRFDYSASGKALSMNESTGFAKVLSCKKTGIVLGVHIFGAHASDIIAEAALAVRNKLTVEQLTGTIHAHPTLSEILMEASEDTMGMSIHK